jgi:hypothetical protein
MVEKRGTKTIKRGKRVKDLPVKGTSAKQAKGVKGGANPLPVPPKRKI